MGDRGRLDRPYPPKGDQVGPWVTEGALIGRIHQSVTETALVDRGRLGRPYLPTSGPVDRRVVENNPHWCRSQRLEPNGRFSSVAPWPPVPFRSRGPCPSGPSLLESTISGKSALPQPPLALAQPYSGSSMSTSTQGPDPSTEGLSSTSASPIRGHPAEVLGQANDISSLPVSPSLESPPRHFWDDTSPSHV